jgi:hypothetical protein
MNTEKLSSENENGNNANTVLAVGCCLDLDETKKCNCKNRWSASFLSKYPYYYGQTYIYCSKCGGIV